MVLSSKRRQWEKHVNWDLLDFVVFGAMLSVVAIAWLLVRRTSSAKTYRFAAGFALATAFVLVWVNGAVGIIGSENNDANLLFFGVPAVALVGALIARFRPGGMAYAMYAAAMAQVLIAAVALLAGWGKEGPAWPRDVLAMSGFFTAMWLLSGLLFRKAAGESSRAA